jgi:methionine synthase I (cobalamin-dependent)
MTRAPRWPAVLGPRASDGVLILDGAMGTELERRGVPMNTHAWCGLANLTAIDTVRSIHEENIAAGADVITTNTFMSGPGPMDRAGASDRFAEGIRNAARVATEAVERADRPVAIAGRSAAKPGRSRARAGGSVTTTRVRSTCWLSQEST